MVILTGFDAGDFELAVISDVGTASETVVLDTFFGTGTSLDLNTIDIDQLKDLRLISGYDADNSVREFDVADSAQAILSAGDTILQDSGVDVITVNDGPASVSEGVSLGALSADIEFDVEGSADDVYNAVAYSSDALDEANSVIVRGGDVTVSEADAIQDISGYDLTSSDYDISDTAAAILSGGDALLNVSGVDVVTVTDGPVSASDGETLTDYSANISFDIRDTADAIAAEVVGPVNANEHDDANAVYVSGGDVTVDEAAAIQAIAGYSNSSNYDITDDATNIKNASSSTLQGAYDVTCDQCFIQRRRPFLKNDGNVDNFTLSASLTDTSSITEATVDEALALLQNITGATNGLTDESVISIIDTVSNLDTISQI